MFRLDSKPLQQHEEHDSESRSNSTPDKTTVVARAPGRTNRAGRSFHECVERYHGRRRSFHECVERYHGRRRSAETCLTSRCISAHVGDLVLAGYRVSEARLMADTPSERAIRKLQEQIHDRAMAYMESGMALGAYKTLTVPLERTLWLRDPADHAANSWQAKLASTCWSLCPSRPRR